MKKYLLGLFAISMLLAPNVQAKTLKDYVVERHMTWGRCTVPRHIFAAIHGVFHYDCSAKKNAELLSHLKVDDKSLGFSVVTGYQKTLRSTMTQTQTNVPVSSLLLKDNTLLTTSVISPKVFLDIEPGATKEEIVKCTTLSTTDFTACTRGEAFSGSDESGSSTLQQTHNAGSVVVISNVHYVYQNLVDVSTTQDVGGLKRFTANSIKIGDGTLNNHKVVFADQGGANLPLIRFNVSTTAWQFSNDGVSFVNITSTAAGGISAGLGLTLNGFTMNINTVNTTGTTALGFIGNTLAVSTTNPNGLFINTDGLAIATSTAQLSWAASSSFTGNAYNGVYINNATTTNATSTFFSANIASTTQLTTFYVSSTMATTTQLFLNGQNATNLSTNSTTDASSLHTLQQQCQTYSYSFPVNVTGITTYYHSLGVIPSHIHFDGMSQASTGNSITHGEYTSSTLFTNQFTMYFNPAQTTVDNAITSGAVVKYIDSNGTVNAVANIVTPVTSTAYFALNATTNNNNSGARRFIATLCK